LAAQERSTLGARVGGQLERLDVDLGSVVREGDILARIESRTFELRLVQSRAALSQARAALGLPLEGDDDRVDVEQVSSVRSAAALLEEAKSARDRLLSLSGTGVASQEELDRVVAAHAVALTRYSAALDEARTRLATVAQRRAELEIAAKQLADTQLVAPFSGAVQERHASIGEYLGVGAPIVTLVRTDPLRLRLEVPERDVLSLRPGQMIRFRVEGSTDVFGARLARLAPALSAESRTLMIEADVPVRTGDAVGNAEAAPGAAASLRPGLFARAEIIVEAAEETLCVPERAITTFAGLEKVVTIVEGKAREVTIATGRRADGWVEVRSGLETGAPVVLDPGGLRTGTPVEVIPGEGDSPPARVVEQSAPATGK
jgi:RND family efflux transporter MFP subunit